MTRKCARAGHGRMPRGVRSGPGPGGSGSEPGRAGPPPVYPTRATDRKRPAADVPRPVGAPSRPGEPTGWHSSEAR
ncbi:hypothetical protein Spla01_03353 [Streptomyces platensis]|uniref:Uncharacterized protein n=1 Tax=Streptomyces platensis TaxID=58346 RepID=A0ABX3XM96_STRPT|nr:hypothetical protein BG653_06623 [Streptomyces platensis]